MLVLTRKLNQKIQVGEATITIVRVGRENVRIGIDAPAHVPVLRSELLDGEKIQSPKSKVQSLAEAAA